MKIVSWSLITFISALKMENIYNFKKKGENIRKYGYSYEIILTFLISYPNIINPNITYLSIMQQ